MLVVLLFERFVFLAGPLVLGEVLESWEVSTVKQKRHLPNEWEVAQLEVGSEGLVGALQQIDC